jgi:hypothetical protein
MQVRLFEPQGTASLCNVVVVCTMLWVESAVFVVVHHGGHHKERHLWGSAFNSWVAHFLFGTLRLYKVFLQGFWCKEVILVGHRGDHYKESYLETPWCCVIFQISYRIRMVLVGIRMIAAQRCASGLLCGKSAVWCYVCMIFIHSNVQSDTLLWDEWNLVWRHVPVNQLTTWEEKTQSGGRANQDSYKRQSKVSNSSLTSVEPKRTGQ